MHWKRALVYDFLELPYVIKIIVAARLAIDESDDQLLTDEKRWSAYFARAQKRNLLPQLREEIDRELLAMR